MRIFRSAALAALAASAIAALAPGVALADDDDDDEREFSSVPAGTTVTAASQASCAAPTLTTPFAPFGDLREYTLAPDGGFEAGGQGWSLLGARVVLGNEPYRVGGAGSRSLLIGEEGSATSPPMCIDPTYPHFRFVVRGSGGDDARLRVEVIDLDARRTTTVGYLGAGGWRPTGDLPIPAYMLTATSGARHVAFRLSSGEDGAFSVDSLFVDPRARF